VHGGDEPDRLATRVVERYRCVAVDAYVAEQGPGAELGVRASRHEAERAAHDVLAGRVREFVLEVALLPAVEPERERAHARPPGVGVNRDEGRVDVEHRREVADEFPEHRLALGRRHRQRGGAQRVLAALAPRDVGRDAADAAGAAGVVEQRELVRQVGARTALGVDDLLEVDRLALLEHPRVVVPERLGRRREELMVQAPDEVARGPAGEALELAVDVEEAPVAVLDEHRGRRVVDHLREEAVRLDAVHGRR